MPNHGLRYPETGKSQRDVGANQISYWARGFVVTSNEVGLGRNVLSRGGGHCSRIFCASASSACGSNAPGFVGADSARSGCPARKSPSAGSRQPPVSRQGAAKRADMDEDARVNASLGSGVQRLVDGLLRLFWIRRDRAEDTAFASLFGLGLLFLEACD